MRNDDFDNYRSGSLDYDEINRIVAQKMTGCILWMVVGLLVSGITGFFVLTNVEIMRLVLGSNLYYVLILLELGLVFMFSMMLMRASVGALRGMFLLYAVLNGVTLSVIGIVYTGESIIYVFLGTVVYYVCLAAYGYLTRDNLGRYLPYVMGGLIALIVVSVINIFLKNDMFYWIMSYAGVIIFSAFTAIDMNIIRRRFTAYAMEDNTLLDRIQIAGALNLYLDFINLFLYLLRLFGKKR
ncbi:Bax inhibitor-1/YccA family protein [Sebaldella sp. S0638]|uniref:Bax inhibitor-1/YccA family protein n=1 Tax=Sebaldella sp. S0638 TaxID=2957809 RepID=UPI00209D399E|nr:Bax inhibitor-1/YccA family protein [Sebaldella sp. S0638]MCP1224176.1 Bax inhibitor-1/YccA family protein [Sebaldella sp. S0638]